ncbi:unnamed protein product [Effrenium voratum]|uniref:Ion transport domain-containing protein n=1 Tax=Effrenium voratum TaxID=2562239 RepID=A0AA36MWF1_9DINO|nr:unnamed protein product [Effrenium voratum]
MEAMVEESVQAKVSLQTEREQLKAVEASFITLTQCLESTLNRLEAAVAQPAVARQFDWDSQQKEVALLPETVDPYPRPIKESCELKPTLVNCESKDSALDPEELPKVEAVKTDATATYTMEEAEATRSMHLISGVKSPEGMFALCQNYLDYVAGALVMLNSIAMMVELQMEGMSIGFRLGLHGETIPLEDVSRVFETIDAVFVFVFLFELLLRVFLERSKLLRDSAFWFDAFLVVAGLADMYLIMPLASIAGEPKNVAMLRLVRALKALRAIRMVRTLRLFRGLRVLVKACQCFLPSLGWSMVLLGVFMSMGALILATLLQDFLLNPDADETDREWIWMKYGTAYRASWTLYEITFAGNWPTNVRPVLEKVSQVYVIFFLLYITASGEAPKDQKD